MEKEILNDSIKTVLKQNKDKGYSKYMEHLGAEPKSDHALLLCAYIYHCINGLGMSAEDIAELSRRASATYKAIKERQKAH
jgi:hypothetical protein